MSADLFIAYWPGKYTVLAFVAALLVVEGVKWVLRLLKKRAWRKHFTARQRTVVNGHVVETGWYQLESTKVTATCINSRGIALTHEEAVEKVTNWPPLDKWYWHYDLSWVGNLSRWLGVMGTFSYENSYRQAHDHLIRRLHPLGALICFIALLIALACAVFEGTEPLKDVWDDLKRDTIWW